MAAPDPVDPLIDPGAEPAPDLGSLVDTLRARVEERRRSGAYPPGLEHDLDVHFRHIVEHRPVRDLDSLHKAMEAFESGLTFDTAAIPTGSRAPGGEVLHRTVSKIITRQTGWLAQQLQEFAESVRVILWKMIETLDNPTHVHADLRATLDAVLDRLAYYERAPADAAMLGSIVRRLEALEAAQPGVREMAAGGPLGEQDLVERLGAGEPSVVLDIGEAAVQLRGEAPGTLGGIALVGRLDALTDDELADLVAGAAAALRPGGTLVVDSPGPPHPAHLTFAFREAGFSDVTVEWRPPPPARGTHCTLTAIR